MNAYWRCFVVAFGVTVMLSTAPLPVLLLFPTLLGIAILMQLQLFYIGKLAKEFWMSAYLKHDSPIRKILSKSPLLHVCSATVAFPMAFFTYVVVFSWDVFDCVSAFFGIALAHVFCGLVSGSLRKNLAPNFAEWMYVRSFYWFATAFIVVALGSISVMDGLGGNFSKTSADQIASEAIEQVRHPVYVIQSLTRTMRYLELDLMRIRDRIGWPLGWFIYVLFITPSALSALGLITFYGGFYRLMRLGAKG